MNPDGTKQMVYYGNMHPRLVMIDAKPIPGSDKILSIFCPGHGRMDHAGAVTILTDEFGPDSPEGAQTIHDKPIFKDPYPFSEDCFLVASANKILLMDGKGQSQILYTLSQKMAGVNLHEPRALVKRELEKVIPPMVDEAKDTGEYVLLDVYKGRNMEGVSRGDIKKLLVLEVLPKPVNFHGGPDLVSWLGTFNLERVLGTVPVEADGSAYFEVPVNRSLFFVALDENDLSVKRMQSFTSVVAGEKTTCIGCHEERKESAPVNHDVMALRRQPSRIESFAGYPDVLDFRRDIQPILDRRCVSCHTYEKREGDVILTGDIGPQFSHSFWNLFATLQVSDGQNGYGNLPPRAIGSSASKLMDKIDGSHYGVELTEKEWRIVWLWIESAAPYAGTYAALRTMDLIAKVSAAGSVMKENQQLIKARCNTCHSVGGSYPGDLDEPIAEGRNIAPSFNGLRARHERQVKKGDSRFSSQVIYNFTRPQYSPILLGPLSKEAGGYGSCGDVFKDKNDPGYQSLLDSLQRGKLRFDRARTYGTEGFRPHPQYVREMKKYGILPDSFDIEKDRIDPFETDQMYWKSLWYKPSASE
jgi:cytochrome c553